MNYRSLYEKNLSAIKKYQPFLIHAIEKEPEDSFSYRVHISKSGNPTIEVMKEQKTITLHSRIDPVKEAGRFLTSCTDGDEQLVFIFGFGLGYQVEELLNKCRECRIVVFEPSITLFRTALHARDFTAILKSERVWLNLGKNSFSFNGLSLDPSIIRIKFLSIRPYRDLFQDILKQLKDEYISFLNRRQINTATIKRFDRLWTKNIFKNSTSFFSLNGVNILRDRLKAIPALVLSAGPSVESDMDAIAELENKTIIIACDTAMAPLIKRGIIPDFVVTVDPQYINSLILLSGSHYKMRCKDLPVLITDPAVYPATLKNYKGIKVLTSSVFSPGRFIEKFSGIKGVIAAGGSVSVASYDFARITGADPIILMGLDLSYNSNQTHLRGSFHEQYLLYRANKFQPALTQLVSYITGGEPFQVKDKFGKPVLTDRRMLLYKSWFESLSPSFRKKTINASAKGLHIEGIEDKKLDKLKEAIKKRDINKKALITELKEELSNFPKDWRKAHEFSLFLGKLNDRLRDLRNISRRGAKLVKEALCRKFFENNISTIKELETIDREILSHGDETKILNMVMQTPISEILKEEELKNAEEAWERSKKLYISIEEACEFLSKLVKISSKKLKELFPDADIKS